ncbi:MAG: F0F1 ATP synthase subunit B [Bacteroidota bacterium]
MQLITPQFGLIFWQTLTLLTVLWILGRFGWKPMLRIIQEREQYVEEALASASAADKKAAAAQAEEARILAAAQAERENIIATAVSTKEAILEEAKQTATRLSQDILHQNQLAIQEAHAASLAALKNEVGMLAVQVAEKLLQKELNTADQQTELLHKLLSK